LLGATDADLAEFFEVSEQTINAWKKAHKGFLESLKAGKRLADAEVAERLFQRAMGYSHPEEKVFNNQGEIVTHQTTKHYPPDPTSMIFWLKNRDPERWRDKPADESGSDDLVAMLAKLAQGLPG
jgi:DNA-binding XRE family transcriptional regulator